MAKPPTTKIKPPETNISKGVAHEESQEQLLPFPIVGIGASAGGLEAFEIFFTHLPSETGMAFVIVQHFDPARKSLLTEILKKYTQMLVVQVEDGIELEPNTIYVIPPNREMELQEGQKLRLKPLAKPRHLRLSIDTFLHSLAIQQKDQAIGIIFSGTGADGTLGLKTIKEQGGLTFAQSPESAAYNDMPVSAINTGMVDVVLPPDKMAEQLRDFVEHLFKKESPPTKKLSPDPRNHLQKIFTLLREQTGHDFSGYKENTILRRIERRMVVKQLLEVEDYLEHLQKTQDEIKALFRELLIGVTRFFRDPEAFESLEQKAILPLLMQPRTQSRQIRVWIPGCSTGEEAYSIAMILYEQMERLGQFIDVQLFATDIDHFAIEIAREARYPVSIVSDISQERVQKFFVKEETGNYFRVRQEIREMVVFAIQSVVKDPPFSRLDLICCRNLLIYLGADLQQKLFSLFHYALNPEGFLFLGNSESIGSSQMYFHTLDAKWKLYQKAEVKTNLRTVLGVPITRLTAQNNLPYKTQTEKPVSMKELAEQILLSDHTPTSLVINEKGDVLYIHGRTGKFLEQTTGEISTNILHMAREGLRSVLTTALRKVNTEKATYVSKEIVVGTNSDSILVQFSIAPIHNMATLPGLMMVVFHELPLPAASIGKNDPESGRSHREAELEDELRSTREYLHTTIEELETTNEELKSAIEELQSANEELQSTNEELQTAKESLQSVNEELVVVNDELQSKVDQLTLANNDIKNLLDNIQVGVIFLDMNLRIRRFTPAVSGIVDLILEDVGRPLAQFVHKLIYERLVQAARETLDTLMMKEIEVQNQEKKWYLLRLIPYYTTDQVVDGVVLTFTDITHIKQAEQTLRESEARFSNMINSAMDAVISVDSDQCIVLFNPAAEKMFGYATSAAIGQSINILIPERIHERHQKLLAAFGKTNVTNRTMGDLGSIFGVRQNGEEFPIEASISHHEQHGQHLYTVILRDITERQRAEKALADSLIHYKTVVEASHDGIVQNDIEGNILSINSRFAELFGYESENEIIKSGITTFDLLSSDEKESVQNRAAPVFESDHLRGVAMKVIRKDGTPFDAEFNTTLMRDEQGKPQKLITFVRDITERQMAEEALRESESRYRGLFQNALDAILVANDHGDYIDANPAACELLGYTLDELLTLNIRDITPETNQEKIRHLWEEFIREGVLKGEYILLCKDQTRVVCDYQAVANIIPHHHISILRNITERKQAEEKLYKTTEQLTFQLAEIEQLQGQLQEQALRDPLTGLYNRRFLNEAIKHELVRVLREGKSLSVIICDIDHFKKVNDNYGHQAGDQFLVELANLLKTHARGSDFVCRYGGEEFLLVLPGITLAAAVKRAEELRLTCNEFSLQYEGKELKSTLSLGIATYPNHGQEAEEIIIKADKALYQAKQNGRNRVEVWAATDKLANEKAR